MLQIVGDLAHAAVSVLGMVVAPPRCAGCDAKLNRETVFCVQCAHTVHQAPPAATPGPAGALVAAAMYGGAVATAINRFKHRDRPDLARPLGHLVRAALRRSSPVVADVVVPVPLHVARLAERGYNQAALLAHEISREIDAPVSCELLARHRATTPQQNLSARERTENLRASMTAHRRAAGRKVLLVDDVTTTGATLQVAADALTDAGATVVAAAVVAQREAV